MKNTNNKKISWVLLTLIIISINFLASYFIAPAPTFLTFIFSPGTILSSLFVKNINLDWTNTHHFFAIASFINMIYYLIIFSIIKIIRDKRR